MNFYGYAGNILHVDLTSSQCYIEPLDMSLVRKFLGGCGIGERLLYNMLKPGTDPLSPENPIIINAGPLVGTAVPVSSKIQLVTKSATLSDKEQAKYYVGRASSGSRYFGTMMKSAGYDLIAITGRSRKPVYLKITDDQVEICPADNLWGRRDIYEVSDELKRRHPGSGMIVIGQAAENLVEFAIGWVDRNMHLGKHGGAAIMGSKNLKAIVVRGTKGIPVWDKARLKTLAKQANQQYMDTNRFKMRRSTPRSSFYPPEILDNVVTTPAGCYRCINPCKSRHQIKEGELARTTVESGFGFGIRLGNRMGLKDYQQALKFVVMSNKLGICYMTAAGMLRFITRLYERNLITTKDTDGLELGMGNITSYLQLLDKIANRDGIGDTMARGWWAIAERFGVDPNTDIDGSVIEKGCTVHIDARGSSLNPLTFSQIVNYRPGQELHPITMLPNLAFDVLKQWCQGIAMSPEEIARTIAHDSFNVGRLTKHTEDGEGVYWALGVCILWVIPDQIYRLETLADLYAAATGIDTNARELKLYGERIWNLGKLLNVREGFTKADDVLPGLWARAIDEQESTNTPEIRLKDYFGVPITRDSFEKMLDDYYEEHGWDVSSGLPTEEKLAKLGLEDIK